MTGPETYWCQSVALRQHQQGSCIHDGEFGERGRDHEMVKCEYVREYSGLHQISQRSAEGGVTDSSSAARPVYYLYSLQPHEYCTRYIRWEEPSNPDFYRGQYPLKSTILLIPINSMIRKKMKNHSCYYWQSSNFCNL